MKTLYLSTVITVIALIGFSFRSISAQTSPTLQTEPPGAVVAFMGDTIPNGWLECDGRCLNKNHKEFLPLFAAIKYNNGGDGDNFCLPDLRGRFLRGVDANDKPHQHDIDSRLRLPPQSQLSRHGNQGNNVGSLELAGTAMPNNPFKLKSAGGHSHTIDVEITAGRSDGPVKNTVANPNCCGSPKKTTDSVGDHNHELLGGDPETRPENISVRWIIKE